MKRIKIISKEEIENKTEGVSQFKVWFRYKGLRGWIFIWLTDELLQEPDESIDCFLKGHCLDFAIENYPAARRIINYHVKHKLSCHR